MIYPSPIVEDTYLVVYVKWVTFIGVENDYSDSAGRSIYNSDIFGSGLASHLSGNAPQVVGGIGKYDTKGGSVSTAPRVRL